MSRVGRSGTIRSKKTSKLFAAERSDDPAAFLDSPAELLTGEDGPYMDIKLLNDVSDPS